MILSREDQYALARAVSGMERDERVPVSPLVEMMITKLHGRTPNADDTNAMKHVFGAELVAQIFAIDPNGPAPNVPEDNVDVPALSDEAALTDKQMAMAGSVGQWLDNWMAYANRRAGMTDDLFLESGGLWLIGLACARRVRLKFNFQTLYNTHYFLWTAPTTYYRKSSGLRVVDGLARQLMSQLLLAGQSSPEMLLYKLAGKRTTNYDDLSPDEQAREDAGRKFAAQRGFISDEMSKLFAKKYMDGLPEVLMEFAENPDILEQEYKGVGKLVVKNAGLSLLFATTPSRLMGIFADGEWEDGLLARFGLLTPEQSVVKRSPIQLWGERHVPTEQILGPLQNLIERLPEPEWDEGMDNTLPLARSVEATMATEAVIALNKYADFCHEQTAPRSGLDYRLTGVYGRLPIHATKVAMSLAAIDWAAQAKPAGIITIGEAHWYRAQVIVEKWRASAHRLLAEVNRSQDEVIEEKVLGVLRAPHRKPPTRHKIWRMAKAGDRQSVYKAIDALQEAGIIAAYNDGYKLIRGA